MGKDTKISWCDHTWNAWRGCERVSTGCIHCYAEALSRRNPSIFGRWGSAKSGGVRVLASPSTFAEVLKWNAAAVKDGVRRRVFFGSLMDVFEDWRGGFVDAKGESLVYRDDLAERFIADPSSRDVFPFDGASRWPPGRYEPATIDHVRAMAFYLIYRCQGLDFLVLTKRIERVRAVLGDMTFPTARWWSFGPTFLMEHPWRHVKIGCSVEDQATADARLYHLMQVPSTAKWVSCEPMVSRVDFACCQHEGETEYNALNGDHGVLRPLRGRSGMHVDWVVVGGESGGGARPFALEWARTAVEACRSHDVPVFVKQMGRRPVLDGVPVALKDRFHGADPAEWPSDLRVQEFYRP